MPEKYIIYISSKAKDMGMRDCDKPNDLNTFRRISSEINQEASFERLKKRVGCINNCRTVTYSTLHVSDMAF